MRRVVFAPESKPPKEDSHPSPIPDPVASAIYNYPTGGPFVFTSASWSLSHPLTLPSRTWKSMAEAATANTTGTNHGPRPLKEGDIISVLTWNIDFSALFASQRVCKAIEHIREKVSSPPHTDSAAVIILLQEVNRCGKDDNSAQEILGHEWVQENFVLAATGFPGNYGTLTLISKNVALAPSPEVLPHPVDGGVRGCFRFPFPHSHMNRDVLGTDILLEGGDVLRVCNVHLESLSGHGTRQRPKQLALVSQLLREPGVATGVVAGDMNAIEPPDWVLPQQEDIQLKDIWIEYNGDTSKSEPVGNKGKSERNESPTRGRDRGHTWGYQSRPTIFWPRRLDKILFRCNEGRSASLQPVEGGEVERLGVDLKVKVEVKNGSDDEAWDGEIEHEDDYKLWVSDHFGLAARFKIEKGQLSGEAER